MRSDEILLGVKIKTRQVSSKSIYGFTIPAEVLRKIGAKSGNYVELIISKDGRAGSYYLQIPSMCPSRTNLQVRRAIPRKIVKQLKIKLGEEITLNKISLIKNIRSNSLIQNEEIDILAAIPKKTKTSRPIMVDVFYKDGEEWCKIWYSGYSRSKQIELKRFIKIDKQLGEFFGLMQAESRKSGYKFDFTNNLISEHELFIRVAERFGIPKDLWKYVLFYNPKTPKDHIKWRALAFQKKFKIAKHISYIKSKTLSDVAFTIYINSNILAEVMISILLALRSKIAKLTKEKNISQNIRNFTISFLCKDLLGDGSVTPNKANKKLDIVISEKDVKSQKDITLIFKNLGIKTSIFKNKIILSSNLYTYLWLLKNGAFEGHQNRNKLIKNVLRKPNIKYFYSRFKDCNRYTKEEFSRKHNLSINASSMYLYRNSKRGYLTKKQNYFELTRKGMGVIEVLKNAEGKLKTNLLDNL